MKKYLPAFFSTLMIIGSSDYLLGAMYGPQGINNNIPGNTMPGTFGPNNQYIQPITPQQNPNLQYQNPQNFNQPSPYGGSSYYYNSPQNRISPNNPGLNGNFNDQSLNSSLNASQNLNNPGYLDMNSHGYLGDAYIPQRYRPSYGQPVGSYYNNPNSSLNMNNPYNSDYSNNPNSTYYNNPNPGMRSYYNNPSSSLNMNNPYNNSYSNNPNMSYYNNPSPYGYRNPNSGFNNLNGSYYDTLQNNRVNPTGALNNFSNSPRDYSYNSGDYLGDNTTTEQVYRTSPIDDQVISQRIRNAIQHDRILSGEAKNIDINSNWGAVTLSGSIRNDSEKRKVEVIAKSVQGVKSVDNHLEVK